MKKWKYPIEGFTSSYRRVTNKVCRSKNVIVITSIVIFSCGTTKHEKTLRTRSEIVTSCVSNWFKSDLKSEQKVKVFHHQGYSIRYMGLVIGVNEKLDTIGVMYKYEIPKIEIGDSVYFRPEKWTDGEKSQSVIIDISNDENAFWYCATKLIYYGRVEM